MTGKRLSREETERRRNRLREECQDYVPARGSHQCQHYAGEGSCKRDDYFMCVVWARRHPEEMYQAQQKPKPRRSQQQQRKRDQPKAQPAQLPEPDKPRAKVYDLPNCGVTEQGDGRHLLERPELLTEGAVDALCKLGIEVTVKTSAGMEVTLVPKLTSADRCELTFEHARTLVMILQVFPGATVQQITKPDHKEAG